VTGRGHGPRVSARNRARKARHLPVARSSLDDLAEMRRVMRSRHRFSSPRVRSVVI